MRNKLLALATIAFLAVSASAQAVDKAFYFNRPANKADMSAMSTLVRTMLDLRQISIDEEQQALITRGPSDTLVALDWLFHQLERPVGTAAPTAPADYKLGDEPISVIPVKPGSTNAEIIAAVTAIRTVCDLYRLFPIAAKETIVGRGSPAQIAAAKWLVAQMLPAEGTAPTVDSPSYPSPNVNPRAPRPEEIRIFRLDPKTTGAELTAAVSAIRTVADLQRLFPFDTEKAIIASGDPDRLAIAQLLAREMSKPPDPATLHQMNVPGTDDVVALFYVGKPVDVAPLVAQIRTTLALTRVYPLAQRSAVVLRGRSDEVKIAGLLVANFADEAH